MLLLVDLDNTLVDRDGAFRAWAASFVTETGGAAADVDWLVEADRGGYRPKDELAEEIRRHLGLSGSRESLIEGMRVGVLEGIRLYDGVAGELARLSASGARIVVVTNGGTAQQRSKVVRAGLEPLIDGLIVSEEVGAKKPSAEIFRAAERLGGPDHESWMVGDSATADIGGAHALGMRTVWVSHGRSWDASLPYAPDVIGRDPLESLIAIR